MPPPAAGAASVRKSDEPPVLLVRWYEVVKWLLERVQSFPKNQRFIFGQRVADAALDIMDLLVDAAYRKEKREVAGASQSASNGATPQPDEI